MSRFLEGEITFKEMKLPLCFKFEDEMRLCLFNLQNFGDGRGRMAETGI